LDRNERLERDLFGEVKAAPSNLENYEEIPVETSGNEVPRAIKAFTDAELHTVLLDNIKLAGYSRPTPVQKHAIPIALKFRDIMACAQTGSGKTAALLFPLITQLLHSDYFGSDDGGSVFNSRGRKISPYGRILAPTRELATQIFEEARKVLLFLSGSPCSFI